MNGACWLLAEAFGDGHGLRGEGVFWQSGISVPGDENGVLSECGTRVTPANGGQMSDGYPLLR